MRQTDFSHVGLAILFSAGIMTNTIADSYSTGSGCFIASNEVLTAYHVVSDSSEIFVALEDGDWMKATILRSDKGLDWAVLKVQGCATATVSVSERSLELGNKVYTLGYPSVSILGLGLKYADGVVSSLTGLAGDVNRFQMTIPIQPGNSGGPVFDEKGSLVGIVSSTVDPDKFSAITGGALPQNLNFAIPVKKIPVSLKKGISCTLENNKLATCFVRCRVGGAQVAAVEIAACRPHADEEVRKKRRADVRIGENVGIVDIEKLFSFELGKSYPFLAQHKAYEKDDTIVCHFAYSRPFRNFRYGRAEISKKSSTLIKLYAYTPEYDYSSGAVACADARSAALLLGEKYGVKMKNTKGGADLLIFEAYFKKNTGKTSYISERDNPIGGTRVDDSLLPFDERDFRLWGTVRPWEHIDATVMGEWEYISWPNYCRQGSNYAKDSHHTVFVTLYEYKRRNQVHSTFVVWIGLIGTEEAQFAANEAEKCNAKQHQDELDAL